VRIEIGDSTQQGRFTCTGGTGKTDDFSRTDLEIDRLQPVTNELLQY
jgi:hypothetical protein